MELYKNTIPIGNIYYMLCYAFRDLYKQDIVSVKPEEFENMQQLMAEIIIKGVSYQLKKGLLRSYEYRKEELSVLRSKIDISETVNYGSLLRRKLVCNFDEYTENTLMNMILKTVMLLLIRSDIKSEQTVKLRKLVQYFSSISQTDLYNIRWDSLTYDRNHSEYRLLMSVCRIICENMLHSTENGELKITAFSEKNLNRLYEKFILNYFARHYQILKPASSEIKWAVKSGSNTDLLPRMHSDIMLTHNDLCMIIDAKFYSRTTQTNYGKDTFHSHNLYQIFTYTQNKAANFNGTVSGMLLYARTADDIIPCDGAAFDICGSTITVRSLDLRSDFQSIATQLNSIAENILNKNILFPK